MLPALLKPLDARVAYHFPHVQVMNASSMEAIIPAATSNSTVGPLGTKIVGQKSGKKKNHTWD